MRGGELSDRRPSPGQRDHADPKDAIRFGVIATFFAVIALQFLAFVTQAFPADKTPQTSFTLTVTRAGTGSGSVTSTPTGIDCGVTCSASFDSDGSVTLTATEATGSNFTGWSGDCTGIGTCTLSLNQARNVTATFTLQTFLLTVTKTGTGSGSVTSTPAGIACEVGCTTANATFDYNTSVTLTATPASSSYFGGWGGGCSGTATGCTVSMTQARSVSADFGVPNLLVVRTGTGQGSVTSDPPGIVCGTTCTKSFSPTVPVTLTATPKAGSVFERWGRDCGGSEPTCILSMAQSRTVTAIFSLARTLTVSTTGTGSGSVTSNPAGINCGTDCAKPFPFDDSVALTATPATGSIFAGWGGDCTGTGTCTVNMIQARNVTATFTLQTFGLTVTKAGTGKGGVTASPTGIDCGPDCAEAYPYGTPVTLTATPGPGSLVGSWTGCDVVDGPTCSVTLTAVRSLTATFIAPGKIGVFRPQQGLWYLDANGNGTWEGCEGDRCFAWGIAEDQLVLGDWNGDGRTKIGVYRSGTWYLDANGNGTSDGCGTDTCIVWGGEPNDQPVVGDWNGDGRTKIGIYRAGTWYLDTNGNGTWDSCEVDTCIAWGGEPGDLPVVGDWNGDGKTKIGIVRGGTWYLDFNGNGAWDGCGIDKCIAWGDPSDTFLVGDWNGDGKTKIGIYRPSTGTWYLDANGNGTWDGCEVEKCIAWGGEPGDLPVVGDWNGDGKTKIGIVRGGTWYLDANGNGTWDGCGTDKCIAWGDPTDQFIVGRW